MSFNKLALKPRLLSIFYLIALIANMMVASCTNSYAQTLKLGKVKFLNSGSEQAQEAFLDGLAALHCFWYQKAFDKFKEAERIDPTFALAYWGESMTYNHPIWYQQDLDGGRSALKQLGNTQEERIAKGKTEIEKALIGSLDLLYGDGTKEERDQKYKGELERLFKKFPDNIEVASFYALSILGTTRVSEGNFKKQLQAANLVEGFLKKRESDVLQHPGLLHYLIHAYDHPRYANKAIKFANLYSKVSADSSHALHMPSHIFLQLGIWDKVVDQNIDSYGASVKWAKLDQKGNEAHDFHSLYWLLYGYLQQGRLNDAKSVLATMKSIAVADSSDRVQGYYGMLKVRYAIESNQWEELSIPKNPTETKERFEANLHAGCVGSESEHNRISTILGLGIGATKTGNLKAAEEAIEHIKHLKASYSNDNGEFDQKILDIQYQMISGLLEITRGSNTKGIGALKKAAEAEEHLDPPSGPPIPAKPATELYAEALLDQNQVSEALKWFKKSLVRTPDRTLSLLGAYRASKKLKLNSASKQYLNSLKRNLIKADPSVKNHIS